jgi:hypothetical protein
MVHEQHTPKKGLGSKPRGLAALIQLVVHTPLERFKLLPGELFSYMLDMYVSLGVYLYAYRHIDMC